MSLRESLSAVVEGVDGALAAMIMGYDGISIDEVVVEQTELDIQLLSVEYSAVLKEIKRAVEIIKMGDLEEVIIATARTRIIVRILNENIFAALIMSRSGNIGKGRYLLKLKSFDVLRELS